MCSHNAANAISGIQILKIKKKPQKSRAFAIRPPPPQISQSFRHWTWADLGRKIDAISESSFRGGSRVSPISRVTDVLFAKK